MKKGFTILELLVASMLLAMLVTVLTMIFQQGSIAWRTGIAGVVDLDSVRGNAAEVRESADNAYIWGGQVHYILGLWDDKGKLRSRAWDVGSEQRRNTSVSLNVNTSDKGNLKSFTTVSIGGGSSGGRLKTYTVNVKSDGPDRTPDTYDDIWSFPDEIN
ncbi:MAG: prepilin-type N-terminal cleavage/methylation domain-containing protein [Kiritimatiellae bacterium]|nr:prepilin-type N-terminal cleavage/methylation domain-containing protein [Kiritimatiellia bacterium]